MRILVLRGGAVGDFLVTLPMLGLLRGRWPDAAIELIGNARAGELGVGSGYLDAVHSQDEGRWSALFGGGPLPAPLAEWLAAFDLVVNYWPDPDGTLARWFPRHAGQRFLSGAAMPMLAPAARHFCETLRPLGLATTDYRSRLPAGCLPPGTSGAGLARAPSASAFGGSRLPVAVHPGSGSARKNWPIHRWRELLGRIDEPVLLVLGEAEREWLDLGPTAGLTGESGPLAAARPPIEISRNLPLPELAATLTRCRLFIGHDSGLSHLAAAVGTPCVLLFGPTEPAMWAPPGDHVRVIRPGDRLEAITVEEVLTAAKTVPGPRPPETIEPSRHSANLGSFPK